jgi:RNA 2',3'-cyclic 3'-phosphodiesterase
MRVFAALPLPPAAIDALAPVQQALRVRCRSLRPTGAAGMHLTLHFFGEVDEGGVRRLAELWRDPALRGPAIAASLGPLGVFPPRGSPRVVWIGLDRGAHAVSAFQGRLAGRLEELGFRGDPRGFTPHLTLARAGTPAPPDGLLEGLPAPRLDFDFAECVLFESILGPRGPSYVPLAAVTFDRGER